MRLARLWRPRIVSVFYPLRDEPDTLPLLTALAAAKDSRPPCPRSSAGDRRSFFASGGRATRLARGAMSIREPLEDAPVVDPDLLFVPLACFDRRGHRIGYGAGYYDRTLARLTRDETRSRGRRRLRGMRSRRGAV